MDMSMRSRGAAAAARRSRSGVRRVYEDIKPMSEWKHEDGADILLYHLPGFVKEQIRIIAESKGILRVTGERFVAGNKWSRFQEEVVVPEHCNMNEIRAKFEGGVLRITMPRKFISTGNTHIIEEETHPTHEPSTSNEPLRSRMQPNPQELPQDLPSKPTLPTTGSSISTPLPHDPSQGLLYESPTRHVSPFNSLSHNQHTHDRSFKNDVEDRKTQQGDDKYDIKSKVDEHRRTSANVRSENEMKERHEEVYSDVKDKHKMLYDDVVGDREKNNANDQVKEGYEGFKMMKKNHIPRNLDEDRQLLTNMGVAILVIMGLGAYISYSFGSTH